MRFVFAAMALALSAPVGAATITLTANDLSANASGFLEYAPSTVLDQHFMASWGSSAPVSASISYSGAIFRLVWSRSNGGFKLYPEDSFFGARTCEFVAGNRCTVGQSLVFGDDYPPVLDIIVGTNSLSIRQRRGILFNPCSTSIPTAGVECDVRTSISSLKATLHFENEPNLAIKETRLAVPEPATWVIMIAGFGLVGGAARRRLPKIAYARP